MHLPQGKCSNGSLHPDVNIYDFANFREDPYEIRKIRMLGYGWWIGRGAYSLLILYYTPVDY